MKQPIFEGTCTALVTPFTQDGVNEALFDALLQRQIDAGIEAVVVCGTTGESSTMSQEEQLSLIRRAVKLADGRCRIIAGTGSNDTRHAVQNSLAAQDAGADAVLVLTPYYNKCSHDGLLLHFEAVAEAISIPMILYNVPSRTGVGMTPQQYAHLAKHPRINGVKEASGNITQVSRTLALCGDELNVWSGNDDQIVSILALGGKGVISVLSNLIPEQTRSITNLCRQGQYAAAAQMQNDYMDLIDALFCEVNPIPIKEALRLRGYDVGIGRLPLCALSHQGKLQLVKAMIRHALL